ncbi:type III secretion system inner membrane R protein [Gemmatirosa kalamazoonensis]|uniref:Type III secretion system inner membrane R protein n=1 Tax=Gemmatirosa kalamazoonensis TaxID=861299 RepID=W0R9H5_9BACT|nr:flagellar biosynthetic protein FliR [Gemmatirosa kalamazoonensis]AHG87739.1 type III secretion system inner membrane R protein [Gemmatirosa kalamazoonensis]
MPGFDLFAPGYAPTLVLLACRVGGLVLIAPVFSAKPIPMQLRTGVLLLLTVLLAPSAHAAALHASRTGPQITPAAFLTESLVGFAIGFGAAVLVGAMETAGDLTSTAIGVSGASLLDPLNGASSSVLAQFGQMFAVTVLLAVNGHLVMLDALAESTRALPVGTALNVSEGLRALLSQGATLFVLGLRFAAPVIAASMIGNVALAVLSRVAPQLNALTIAFPIQIALGLVALCASLAFVATWMTGWGTALAGQLELVFHAFAAR